MAFKVVQVLLLATLIAAAYSSSDETVTYTGTFVKLMEDYFKEGVARHKYGLKDTDDGHDFVELNADDVLSVSANGVLPIGQVVTIRGVRSSVGGLLNTLRLTALDILRSKRVNGRPPGFTGDKKILVILTQLANSTYGTTSTTCSASTISANFWTATTNINGMFQFASRGALSANQNGGAVVGPFTVQARTVSGSQTTFDCDPYAWANAAKAAASAAGTDPNAYDVIHYSLPNYQAMNCGWGGLGEVGGPNSWTAQCALKSTSAHEIGHNMGFQHSSSLVNNVFAEYGDGTCVMGDDGSRGDLGTSYHVIHRRQAGWLSYSNAFVQVTNQGSTQNFQLLDYNANVNSLTSTTPFAIQFQVADGTFYFSYHKSQSSGYDTGLAGSNATTGSVTVHFWTGDSDDHPIRYGPFLSVGNSYYNATGRWRVTVTAISSTAATVAVAYDSGAPCQTSVLAEGFEDGLSPFTFASSSSSITPVLTTSRSAPTSPSTSANLVESPAGTAATQSLSTPALTVPAGTSTLQFAMKYYTDPAIQSSNVIYCTEAAIVSVLIGTSKTQLNTSVAYSPYRVWSGYSNPLAGKNGWCSVYSNDVETSWQTASVDISAYAGQSVKFVWDFGTDSRTYSGYTPTGFFFDDIQINNQAACGAGSTTTTTTTTTTTGVRTSTTAVARTSTTAVGRSTGVQTTGVQTTGVQTTGIQTTGIQTTGIQTTGRQSSGFLFGKRNVVAEKSQQEMQEQVLAKRAASEALAVPNSRVLPVAAAGALLGLVVLVAVVVAKIVRHTRVNNMEEVTVPFSA